MGRNCLERRISWLFPPVMTVSTIAVPVVPLSDWFATRVTHGKWLKLIMKTLVLVLFISVGFTSTEHVYTYLAEGAGRSGEGGEFRSLRSSCSS